MTSFVRRWPALLMFSATAAGVLPSCGVRPHTTIKSSDVTAQVVADLESTYHVVPTVQCQSGIPDKKGVPFVCHAAIEGQSVTLNGETSGGGSVTLNATAPILVVTAVVAQIQQDILKAYKRRAEAVDCGTKTVLVVPVGRSFGCTATFAGQPSHSVTVTVDGPNGLVTIDVAGA